MTVSSAERAQNQPDFGEDRNSMATLTSPSVKHLPLCILRILLDYLLVLQKYNVIFS